MEKIIIIGGGVAGLSCLNAFLDNNISPLLLEGGTIGSPKMCGEFLAPQAVTYLQRWQIKGIQNITHAQFLAPNSQVNVTFPKAAGAISRSEVELQLADRAKKYDGRIREESRIAKVIPATDRIPYTIHLSSGEEVQGETVVFATGKFNQNTTPPSLPYFGIKFHIKHIENPHSLLMCANKGAYFGLVPINDEWSNFACLITRDEIEKLGSCTSYFHYLLKNNRFLENILNKSQMINWLEGSAPEFQLKTIPNWPHAFWIGDALATFYPAIGSGFAHSITSGILAVEHYLAQKEKEYKALTKKHITNTLRLGKVLHHALLNPSYGQMLSPIFNTQPWLIHYMLKKLRYY